MKGIINKIGTEKYYCVFVYNKIKNHKIFSFYNNK